MELESITGSLEETRIENPKDKGKERQMKYIIGIAMVSLSIWWIQTVLGWMMAV